MSIDYEALRISAEVRELVAEFVSIRKRRKVMDLEVSLCHQQHKRNRLENNRLVKLLNGLNKQIALGTISASDRDLGNRLVAENTDVCNKERRALAYMRSLLDEQEQQGERLHEIHEQLESLAAEALQKGCDIDLDFPELEEP
jgi:hypothetical protein